VRIYPVQSHEHYSIKLETRRLAGDQDSNRPAHQEKILGFAPEPRTRFNTLLSLALSRAILVVTLSSLVLKSKGLIRWHFDGLETFFNVCSFSGLRQSQMAGVRCIYRLEGTTYSLITVMLKLHKASIKPVATIILTSHTRPPTSH